MEAAVKLLISGMKGPFVVKYVSPSPSSSASADQVLIHLFRPLCCAGYAKVVLISLKTFRLDTEGNKGLCILLKNSKCLNLAGSFIFRNYTTSKRMAASVLDHTEVLKIWRWLFSVNLLMRKGSGLKYWTDAS